MNLRQLFSTFLWITRRTFRVAPFWYSGLAFSYIAQSLLPIAQTYALAQILAEAVSIISGDGVSFSQVLIYWIIIALVATILRQLSDLGSNFFWFRLRYVSDEHIYGDFLSRLAQIDMPYHEDPIFQSDIKKIEDALAWRVMSFVQSSLSLLSQTIGILLISSLFFQVGWWILVAILVPVILDYFISIRFGSDMWGIWLSDGDEKKQADHALDGFKNREVVRESKIYAFGEYIADKYREAYSIFTHKFVGKLNRKYLSLGASGVLSATISVGLHVFLLSQLLTRQIFLAQYSFLLGSLGTIGGYFASFQMNLASLYENGLYVFDLKRIFELPDLIDKTQSTSIVPDCAPKIEFRNVSFSYPKSKEKVLDKLSFTIEPGKRVALIGENGAGKTTIIKLLARFYDVQEGEILVNDINIREIDLKTYYHLWGVLFQYFARYWFTVTENVALSRISERDDTVRVSQALARADAESLVEKLPRQEATMLSTDFTDGVDLSGGEWQKIGIARCMFAEPKFIILDEPTSALDALAESRVFDQLYTLAEDTTMLIVSHRFATVRKADSIIVLQHGRIVEQGTHAELMSHRGLYEEMFTTQAAGYLES
ncbi:ABC transporter ATP-binding protein [Candidatus Gracilibacteria bacterium]|nr:ABC transporter ATP-binding protein [Candidatus Gracilibacteria bacterium]